MVRKPIVASQFYEGTTKALVEEVRNCFTSKFGPGSLPEKKISKEIKGAIVPHAGYFYSGAGASHVYKALAESKKPDLFLIFGPNHTGLGQTSICLDDFETPLGIAKVDKEFGNALIKNSNLENNPSVHQYEHSIEVQIPFLQYVLKDFMFLPIVISSAAYLDDIAEAIKKTIKETKKKVCLIASSDFTHYGFSYGYAPFSDNIRENIEKLDNGAIEYIKKMDSNGFLSYINKTGATICGYLPIALLLKTLEQGKVELLNYYMSGDVVNDYSTSVSYASIVIY